MEGIRNRNIPLFFNVANTAFNDLFELRDFNFGKALRLYPLDIEVKERTDHHLLSVGSAG